MVADPQETVMRFQAPVVPKSWVAMERRILSAARVAPCSSVSGSPIAQCGGPTASREPTGSGARANVRLGGRKLVRSSEFDEMTDQGELFPPVPGSEPLPPLATRMRPKAFENMVGQQKVVEVLRRLTQGGNLPSIILWGPLGSGKTTLAGLLSTETGARMVAMSAVTTGVADLRMLVAEAKVHRRAGIKTVLFIDEIHRFNK